MTKQQIMREKRIAFIRDNYDWKNIHQYDHAKVFDIARDMKASGLITNSSFEELKNSVESILKRLKNIPVRRTGSHGLTRFSKHDAR